MAKQKTIYQAMIVKDDETLQFLVDILDLPRNNFDKDHPLIILEDVNMGQGKKQPLPSFENVIINGTFDCSTYTLNESSVLPRQIRELRCLHSINDISILMNIIPKSVKTIVIRTALLNAVKKNKNNELDKAKQFIQKYPNVTVTDNDRTLAGIVAQVEHELKSQTNNQTPQKTKNKAPENTDVDNKTDDWYSTEELIQALYETYSDTQEISEQDLQRFIQMARSSKNSKKIQARSLKREDGVNVICVHKSELNEIYTCILSMLNEQKLREEKTKHKTTKKQAKKTEVETQKKETETKPKTFYVGAREISITEIKKYIPKKIWNEIKSATGGSKTLMRDILNAIDVINVNPCDTDGDKVVFIQDNQVKTSATLKFKNARRLCQGFGLLNDRQRIIWAISNGTFVCTDFFPEHEKNKTAYRNAIRDTHIAIPEPNPDEHYEVSSLIKMLRTPEVEHVNKTEEKDDAGVKKTQNDEPKAQPATPSVPQAPQVQQPNTVKPTEPKVTQTPVETKPVKNAQNETNNAMAKTLENNLPDEVIKNLQKLRIAPAETKRIQRITNTAVPVHRSNAYEQTNRRTFEPYDMFRYPDIRTHIRRERTKQICLAHLLARTLDPNKALRITESVQKAVTRRKQLETTFNKIHDLNNQIYILKRMLDMLKSL